MEEMVKDQFGGRIRRGSDDEAGCARAAVKPRRVKAVVVYFIAEVETEDEIMSMVVLVPG
jgi:hypothetical protein